MISCDVQASRGIQPARSGFDHPKQFQLCVQHTAAFQGPAVQDMQTKPETKGIRIARKRYLDKKTRGGGHASASCTMASSAVNAASATVPLMPTP